jgi:hypothetical protein
LDQPFQDAVESCWSGVWRGNVVRLQVVEIVTPGREATLHLGDCNIVKMSVVPAVAELFGNAQGAQQLRLLEQEPHEILLAKEIKAEWAKPDQVDDGSVTSRAAATMLRAIGARIGRCLTDSSGRSPDASGGYARSRRWPSMGARDAAPCSVSNMGRAVRLGIRVRAAAQLRR